MPRTPVAPITAAADHGAEQGPDEELRPSPSAPFAGGARSALHKLAYRLALDTQRHPGEVNAELNRVMGVRRRDEATEEQLRGAMDYAQGQLDSLGATAMRDARCESDCNVGRGHSTG